MAVLFKSNLRKFLKPEKKKVIIRHYLIIRSNFVQKIRPLFIVILDQLLVNSH